MSLSLVLCDQNSDSSFPGRENSECLCYDRCETLVLSSVMFVTFSSDMNCPNECLVREAAKLIAQYLQRLIALRAELQFKAQARYSDLA